jgi:Fe-S cluster biogenesis protein NfuA
MSRLRLGTLPPYNWLMPSAPSQSPPLREKVQEVINLIRPAVQADGGDIELVNVLDDGVVQIRFHGACHGCPSSTMTLQMGIERNLREKVPEVTRVVPVV